MESHEASLNDEWDSEDSRYEGASGAGGGPSGSSHLSDLPLKGGTGGGLGISLSTSESMVIDGAGAETGEADPGATSCRNRRPSRKARQAKEGKQGEPATQTKRRFLPRRQKSPSGPAGEAPSPVETTDTNANQTAVSAAAQHLQQQARSGQIPPSSAMAMTLAAMPPDSLWNLLQSSLLGALSAMPLPNELLNAQRNLVGAVGDSHPDHGKSLSASKQPAELQQASSTSSSAVAMAVRPHAAAGVGRRQPSVRKAAATHFVPLSPPQDGDTAHAQVSGRNDAHARREHARAIKTKRGWRKCLQCKHHHHWNTKCQPAR